MKKSFTSYVQYWMLFFSFLSTTVFFGQNDIADFISLAPTSQTSNFNIPSSHVFQKIIETGDPLTQGGVLPDRNDFTAYVPINGSNENGYLSINSERIPGGVSILDINFDTTSKQWQTSLSQAVDFTSVAGTIANCSGTVTPWNTVISCEEFIDTADSNADGYNDIGWCIEIDPATKTVLRKLWALGNFKHENVSIHSNLRTVYQGADSTPGYLYKFVANNEEDLSSGLLYVYQGAKDGAGNWILLNNTTAEERNTTLTQSAAANATVFEGIEDVEIGPDGMVYFAVKGEGRVYRFQDSDPLLGTSVPLMETYVGNASYDIMHENGVTTEPWGLGNDNLVFDGDGNLWVCQDGGNNYIWVVKNGHTQASPDVSIFGQTPIDSEPTGITFSPDYRFLFMSIQHPANTNNSSTQEDTVGNAIGFEKSISLVIALKENLGTLWYLDADMDGFATEETISSFTSPGAGYTNTVLPTTDCDDSNAAINPETVWYIDADMDGFASEATITSCVSPGMGYTTNILPATDCDDTNIEINPETIWYLDADMDGFATETTIVSCTSPGIGYTTNMLPATDCDDTNAMINPETVWYLDADMDGYATETTIVNCTSPGIGYTTDMLPATDCDDTNAMINPETVWYLDADMDGYAAATTVISCVRPGDGYTTNVLPTTDCDDSDPDIQPLTLWYLDADNDGDADEPPIQSCTSPGEGYTMTPLPLDNTNDRANAILYPNPSTNQITIDLNQVYENIELSIVSSSRQLVFNQKYDTTNQIDLQIPQLRAGVYFILITSSGKKISDQKIVVQ